jgi:ArsR family transcriptional regulator
LEDEELDSLLQVLENPIRRKIVKRLSHGPSYPLQLSKELGLGQPLVAKHLSVMEKAGVVTSEMESSPRAPKRRNYSLAKSVSITLDLAPNLFVQRGFAFGTVKGKVVSEEASSLIAVVSKISESDKRAVASLAKVLKGLDQKLDEIDKERAALLYVRNMAMDTASEAIKAVEDTDQRRVIYKVLEEHTDDVGDISESLDMREALVRKTLEDLHDMLE